MSREASDPGTARTLVLNALVDAVGDGPRVLADRASRGRVEAAYRAATTAADREAVREALCDLDVLLDGADDEAAERGRTLTRVADAVLDELAADGVRATLDHTARASLVARDAHLYTFMTVRDPAAVEALSLPAGAAAPAREGADLAVDGAFDAAAAAFDAAVDAALGGRGAVAARVLAGWATHRAGDDARAMDFVEEALHLDTGAWSATCVGLAADSRRPGKFRTGKLGARAFLRHSVAVPEGGSVTAAVGLPGGAGGAEGVEDIEWTDLSGSDECMPVDRLAPETRIRLRLSGTLPAFPTVLGYYLALGVVDLEVNEARSAERVFLGGPETADATETVRLS